MPDVRLLRKRNALKLFAPFATINSDLSDAAELRLQSRHVVGFPMENRFPITRRDVASELPRSNERFKLTQCGTLRTPQARGLGVAGFRYGSPTEVQRRRLSGV
jgi:hypothetical protein